MDVRAAGDFRVLLMIPELNLDETQTKAREEQPENDEDSDDAAFGTAAVHPGVARTWCNGWQGVSLNIADEVDQRRRVLATG